MRIVVVLIGLSLSGCGAQLSEFVGERESPTADLPWLPFQSGQSEAKISPGSQVAAGSTVKSKHTLTPTYQMSTGQTVISTHRFHVQRFDPN